MSQNPFDPAGGLPGGGGFDMGALLQQAQQMQEQLVAAQAELEEAEVDGSAGGVTVRVSGSGELKGVVIPPGVQIGVDQEADLARGFVVDEGLTVLAKQQHVPED